MFRSRVFSCIYLFQTKKRGKGVMTILVAWQQHDNDIAERDKGRERREERERGERRARWKSKRKSA